MPEEEVREGIGFILAQQFSDDEKIRAQVLREMQKFGNLKTSLKKVPKMNMVPTKFIMTLLLQSKN